MKKVNLLIKFKDGTKVCMFTKYSKIKDKPFFKDIEWIEPISIKEKESYER
jgi:hypothetical protein